ncbi:MAG TPA: hypothetical protein VHV51_24300 [Polyangiaceae bacterium]|jgi:hypothetical protein|nr:hypothetical protein [Polyangiaceae bacterium]
MRTARWSPLVLLAGVVGSVFACTFSANDYKLVAASGGAGAGGAAGSALASGGGGASAGGTAGKGGAGRGGSSGAMAAAGALGEGGASGASNGCVVNMATPLTVFSSADLHQTNVTRFNIIAGTGAVFALAFVDVPGQAATQTHALIRNIVDANKGTLRGIADLTFPATFLFGGAWATDSEIDLIGADSRGIIQVTIPLNAMGNADLSNMNNVVVKPLQTPTDCMTEVRQLRIARNASGMLSYVASCVPDLTHANSLSLWLSTASLQNVTQIGTTAVTTDNLIRSFVRNGPSGAVTNLLLVGQDELPTADFRTGEVADLETVNTISMTSDPNWLEQTILSGIPAADGGTFMTVTKLHDPKTGLVPVEVWAGSIASNAYGTLTQVPPPELALIQSYTAAADVYFPQEWSIQGTTVYIVSEDQAKQQNLALWVLDQTSDTITEQSAIYGVTGSANVVSDVRLAELTASTVVGWVETPTTGPDTVYAESFSCP